MTVRSLTARPAPSILLCSFYALTLLSLSTPLKAVLLPFSNGMISYALNLGFRIAVFVQEREQDCLEGGMEEHIRSLEEHKRYEEKYIRSTGKQ